MAVEPQHELLGRDVVVRLTLVRTMSDGVQDIFLADAVLEGEWLTLTRRKRGSPLG